MNSFFLCGKWIFIEGEKKKKEQPMASYPNENTKGKACQNKRQKETRAYLK